MGILPNKPLPKHQIIIFTHEAIRKKVRGATLRDGKSYPHRPYADGGTIKRGFTKEMSNVLNSQVDLCKPDAKKKPPLASPAPKANGGSKERE